ncbi:MAG: metallophosphoesterase [Bacteroidetes bacterium]|nr:metallophosphoesterase [Bacteroidota bacterium]
MPYLKPPARSERHVAPVIHCAALLVASLLLVPFQAIGQERERAHDTFRVFPYLVSPADSSVVINWFTESSAPGRVTLRSAQCLKAHRVHTSTPQATEVLSYSDAERADRAQFPDMFSSQNYKHSVTVEGLVPGCAYSYAVEQSGTTYKNRFHTPPPPGSEEPIRFITFADSETGPKGRSTRRRWIPGAQAVGSTGRPDSIDTYLLTEAEGFQRNLDVIAEREPDFLLISGDIVQGGGYQRAWDEFFFHMAGQFDNILSSVPLVPALGNWENSGGAYGGYDPDAIARGRRKFQAYFNAPANNNPDYRNYYYRIDYGPVTVLTLDSSNGLPDSTDQDTNVNINLATYPGDDLPDINPGSDQWRWAEAQLQDARREGQVIFVQFHHPPYSAGWHSLPLTMPGSSGQSGVPMRAYTPLFEQHGVAAVFAGHNESFEHSVVNGIHFYDVGVAGDGFGIPLDTMNAQYAWWDDLLNARPAMKKLSGAFENSHQVWVAHHDAPEHWRGAQLIDGGKHYGHLEVNVQPQPDGTYAVRMTPVYVFPVTGADGKVGPSERRVYDDVVSFTYDAGSGQIVGEGN